MKLREFNINYQTLYKKKKKKNINLFLLLILVCCIFSINFINISAQNIETDYVNDLYESTFEEIENLDLTEIENLLNNLEEDSLFKNGIVSSIKDIVNGEFDINAENIFSYIAEIFTKNIKTIFPVCLIILIISIIIRILSSFSPSILKDGIMEIINFVAIGVVIVFLGNYVLSVNNIINSTVSSMQTTINVLFPILLTLMGAVGATSSVAIYTPITTILNTTVSTIISKFLYPLYLVSFALIIISCISKRVKVGKLIDFISSLFKTALAFVFTIFSSIFMIKGISAGKYDSVSIYTTKFAVKNYIPLIGSYISEGFNYIMLSSVIVKNAVGLAGIIIILVVVLSPVIYLLILKLMLSLTASMVDMVGNSEISGLLDKVAKITAYPIAIILGVAFMFIMTLSLLMCTANLI